MDRMVLVAVAALSVLAYLPVFRQPLLEDDYPNIALALSLGAPGALHEMAGTVFRFRATSLWLMRALYQAFGISPTPYYCVSLALHILCAWLVYAMGYWKPLGFRVSAWAAAFFAIYEGHQEAVMWFSACNELMQFLFGVGALVCWLHFLYAEKGRTWWYCGALIGFVLALISKESAVIFAALFCLPLIDPAARRRAAWIAPFLALAGVEAAVILGSRGNSFRFHDGSFSLHAPFWKIWPLNFARLFWVWGLLGAVAAWQKYPRVLLLGVVWAGISLLPYSFLTYSARIPSRQLYLASAGVAFIVAAGFLALPQRKLAAAVCVIAVAHNVGYLWTKKRRQFLERAEPTQQLISLARSTQSPIYVECFPRPALIAEEAAHLGAGRSKDDLIWDAVQAQARKAVPFCYKEK